MKKVLITILFFYFAGCNVKEKEHPEGATTKDSSGTSAIADSSKGVTNAVNLDKSLNVTATDSIGINRINERVFELEQSGLFFLAFNRNKVAANLNEEEGLIDVLNPYSRKVYDQIDLMKYTKDFFIYKNGFSPSDTKLGRNNIGQVKIMITDNSSTPHSSLFSISNLDLSNLKTHTITLENNKKRLFITDYNKLFSFDDLIFYNDSLYYLYDLEEIDFLKEDTLLYKISFVNDEMILCNGSVINHGNNYCILSFPYKDKIFFSNSYSDYTDLFSYNIITGESKKYVIPFLINQFYFAEDGFFIAYIPPEEEVACEMYRYSFVGY
ncbi:MAG: hypothetical protein NVV82_27290 [Sporocytophaga sp.]|jgi:hypothetical protein|nr:hypothetical protein [Sporocytophaga sp.]